MIRPLPLVALLFTSIVACDDAKPDPAASVPDPGAADAEADARLEKRKQERLAKEKEKADAEAARKQKIQEVTVIPQLTKLPKNAAAACEQVVAAQKNFMKKFHPEIDDAALTTQLGLIGKQCNDMKKVQVAMCQKFALDATTEDLKGSINEYLPVCMEKYGKAG